MVVGTMGLRTKNDCAVEGQQQFPQLTGQIQQVSELRVVRQKNTVMDPKVPGTKNDYSGKGQQQSTQNQKSVTSCESGVSSCSCWLVMSTEVE
jgi:hypothetical protein